MRTYILRRLLLLFPIVFGVTVLTFIIFRLIPGDPAEIYCGIQASPECVQGIRDRFGLDRQPFLQYFQWLGGVFQGDLGESIRGGPSLSDELRHRLPVTFQLLIMTFTFSVALGIPPGVISAIRPGTPLDWLVRSFSVLGLSIPYFWLGTLFVIFPAIWFDWVPPSFGRGYIPFFDDPWANLQEFILPALALALALAAGIMRLTRSSLLEVLGNDYIRTAWAKGLRERTIVIRHALKNAMIPVVTVLSLQVGVILGGSILIEAIFALPGMGLLIREAVLTREYFIVQGITFLAAILWVLTNLAIDLVYAWLDPRIHYA